MALSKKSKSLSKKTCRIYIARKKNTKTGNWENRLSIIENVNGKNTEVLFIKDESGEQFIKKLKIALTEHKLKHYSIVRRNHRYSRTFREFFMGSTDMRKVLSELYEEVSDLLARERDKAIAKKNKQVAILN